MYPPKKLLLAQRAVKAAGGKNKKKNTVRVAVRVRPLSKVEKKNKDWHTMRVFDESLINLKDPKDIVMEGDPLHRSRECKFQFDLAFGVDTDTKTVYEETVKPAVGQVMSGEHVTVFAYGATGSGKTYTMAGPKDNPGVIPLTIHDLFEHIKDMRRDEEAKAGESLQVSVTAFYLEIYNEELRDLLTPNDDATIALREDPKGVRVSGVTEYPMESPEDVFRILELGGRQRATDSHQINDASSRSHAILQISVDLFKTLRVNPHAKGRMTMSTHKRKVTQTANLTLIDLAGSERAKRTGTNKKMLREGAKINRSLLALANCINALVANKKGLHIPYRDSKLTRLLKESLSGGGHTIMIANVSCASGQFDETRETLLYANRAKNIKISASMEKKANKAMMQKYSEITSDLKEELLDLKATLSRTCGSAFPSRPVSVMSSLSDVSEESGRGSRASMAPPAPRAPSKEVKEANSLVNRIVSNFSDLIEARRSLMESEEEDAANEKRIEKINRGLLTDAHVSSEERGKQGGERDGLVETLESNARHRKELEIHAQDLESTGIRLRSEVKKADFRNDRMLYLNLMLEKCAMELQKTELELEIRAHEKHSTVQDEEIARLNRLLQLNNVQDKGASYNANYKSRSGGPKIYPELCIDEPPPRSPRGSKSLGIHRLGQGSPRASLGNRGSSAGSPRKSIGNRIAASPRLQQKGGRASISRVMGLASPAQLRTPRAGRRSSHRDQPDMESSPAHPARTPRGSYVCMSPVPSKVIRRKSAILNMNRPLTSPVQSKQFTYNATRSAPAPNRTPRSAAAAEMMRENLRKLKMKTQALSQSPGSPRGSALEGLLRNSKSHSSIGKPPRTPNRHR